MANLTFPSNPTNGQKVTVNDKVFVYNSTTSRWTATRLQIFGNLTDDFTIPPPELSLSNNTVAFDTTGQTVYITYTVDQDVKATISNNGIANSSYANVTLHQTNNTIQITAGTESFSGANVVLTVTNTRTSNTASISLSQAIVIDYTTLSYGSEEVGFSFGAISPSGTYYAAYLGTADGGSVKIFSDANDSIITLGGDVGGDTARRFGSEGIKFITDNQVVIDARNSFNAWAGGTSNYGHYIFKTTDNWATAIQTFKSLSNANTPSGSGGRYRFTGGHYSSNGSFAVLGNRLYNTTTTTQSPNSGAILYWKSTNGGETFANTPHQIIENKTRTGVVYDPDREQFIVGNSLASSGQGRAYVYKYNDGTDTYQNKATLSKSDTGTGTGYGDYVFLRKNTAIVGARNHSSSTGRVYIYERDDADSAFSQTAYLQGPHTDSFFGQALWISNDGDTIAVAAPDWNYSASGYGANQGKVFFYVRDTSTGNFPTTATFEIEGRLTVPSYTGAGTNPRFGSRIVEDPSDERKLWISYGSKGMILYEV
jgi:hypothetical protein